MKIKPLFVIVRTFKILLIIIASLFITYSVLFSIAGTTAIYMAYSWVTVPIKEVQELGSYNPPQTAYMKRYREELAEKNENDTLHQIFIPLDSISPHLKSAVLAAEDDGFYTHPGIALESILQAAEYNRTQGTFKRGASTITQQLAKNLFLTSEKSFERKGKELGYSLLMEKYLGKDRIFELYLNYAQWGKNIFGCEAAARQYFNKSASKLSRNEAARLAAVLAMPSKMSPYSKSNFMGKRLAVIANNLYLHKSIDDSSYFGLTGSLPPQRERDSSAVEKKAAQEVGESRVMF